MDAANLQNKPHLSTIDKNYIQKFVENIKENLQKIKEEFDSIPISDKYNVSALRGAINAGLWGSIIGGPITGASSITGSVIGNLVGKKTQNPILSLITSTLVSSAAFSALSLRMGINNPLSIIVGAISAAIASNIGNLTSTSSKEINNNNSFAFKLLPLAFAFNLPATLITTSTVSSQLPNIFEADENKKLLLAVLTSLGLGFGLSIIGGPINAAIFALLNTILTIINHKFSQKTENFFEKVSNFLSSKISNFLTPHLSFLSKLPKKLKGVVAGILIGGVSTIGASTLATILFPMIGPLAFGIPLSLFLLTSFSVANKINNINEIQENTNKYLQKIQTAIEQNNLTEASKTYKELIIKNLELSEINKEQKEETIKQVNNLNEEQLKQTLFQELSNIFLSNSIKYYINKDVTGAVEEFRKLIILQQVFNGQEYSKAKEEIDKIPSQQILQNIEYYLQQLNNNKQNQNNQ